jgi:glucosamine kinase
MILIADSGSTKTTWAIVNEGKEVLRMETAGLNPNFYHRDFLDETISSFAKKIKYSAKITSVSFYGSGCGSAKPRQIIQKTLKRYFPSAKKITVGSDLLGAARALCGEQRGVACILGTGSNACLYDGKVITAKAISYGWMFGDYGSGAHLGKLLIQDYCDDVLPSLIKKKLEKDAGVSHDMLIGNLYRSEFPNRFLASFSIFIEKNKKHAYCAQLIESSFSAFLEKQLGNLRNAKKHPLHFAGSVASAFQPELLALLKKKGFKAGRILKSPIEGLINFHTR